MNQALSASFHLLFTDIWDSLTETEEMVYVEVQAPMDERVVLRSTGLTEAELSLLLGKPDGEVIIDNSVESIGINDEKANIEGMNIPTTRTVLGEGSTQEFPSLRDGAVERGRTTGKLTV
jgi:hypothetical protein